MKKSEPYDVLITTADRDGLIKYIEKKKKYKLNDEEKEKLWMEGEGRTVQLEGGQIIIRLRKEKTKIGIDLPHLIHEISHAVFFTMDKIGVKHTYDSDEVFAYYSAYLTREALNFFDP